MESEHSIKRSESSEAGGSVAEFVSDDQQPVNRQFDEVCLNETVPDVISEPDPGPSNVEVPGKQSLETSLPLSVPCSPVNGVTDTEVRSMSSASNSSQEIMYSIGNTPLSTPVKVPKSLSEEEKKLLVEMEQQNQVLDSVKAVEEKYQKRIDEEIELRRKEEELRGKLGNQVKKLEEKVERQQEEFAATISDVKSRLGSKLDQMTKSVETSKKDLESMVIKYATSESQIITAKKAKETAEYKLQQQVKENESLNQRIKGLTTDKNNLTAALDRRILEVSNLHREMDKQNHDLKEKEGKIITLDHKLKCEEESGKELKEKNDNLNNLIKLLKEEIESKRTVTEDGISIEDLRNENGSLKNEIDSVKQEMEEIREEKIQLEGVIKENELKLDSFIEENEHLKEKLDETESKLHRELESKSVLLNEMDEMKKLNMSQSKELDVLRQKEAELMEFSEAAKTKTNNLQIEINELINKVKSLEEESNSSSSQVSRLMEEKMEVESELNQLKVAHEVDIGNLKEDLRKKGSINEKLKSQVDELINDQRVMIKKHHNIVREVNKELASLKKKVDLYESNSSSLTSTTLVPPKTVTDSLSNHSRTSSSSSLTDYNNSSNTLHQSEHSQSISNRSPNSLLSGQVAVSSNQSPNSLLSGQVAVSSSHSSSGETNCDHALELSNQEVVDLLAKLDKEKLVERIIKLQRNLTKKNEKVDFLEDHNHQLVQELKKKIRLVQHYLMREESGALTTSVMDSNKEVKPNKKELARKGSTIMTSLYKSSDSNSIDSNMTLELSLEINRKLQSVLEDTILKNIALKESIQTLGDEIARLSANGSQTVSK